MSPERLILHPASAVPAWSNRPYPVVVEPYPVVAEPPEGAPVVVVTPGSVVGA